MNVWTIQKLRAGYVLSIVEDGEQPVEGVIQSGEVQHPAMLDQIASLFLTTLHLNMDELGFDIPEEV